MTIWRMHIGCWVPKATNTHSEYVILIPFPQQQWLHGRPSMLSFTYTACFFSLSHPHLSSQWSPSFRFSISSLMHLIFLDLIMPERSTKYESLNMQFSPPSRYLIFLRRTYSSHHPVLTHPHFAANRHVSH